ncbi:hypothetical protein [Carboxylicivirga linearis]|uniref:Uncharacterized protein n=1 Tax=Carboxylicivirga linearis TaxID=1628157 RepID=A0ABS5JX97_9BACT|nr:hypothetical protein [Carboxylicivirga linearis]MBS2099542.1 hypothetical protein [Carboxylicivirga linearis]
MKSINAYHQIVNWQKANNICIGDQIRFMYKGRLRSGYLTGFDIEHNPLKLIVRYVSTWGMMQIATIEKEAVTSKCKQIQVV